MLLRWRSRSALHFRRSLRRPRDRIVARERRAGVARLRQSDGACRAEERRDGSRSWLRRRHRRSAFRPPRRPFGQSLRARHDRRHAGVGSREPEKGGSGKCRVLEGRDRVDPIARQFGRRDHLQLRHQPIGGQGPGAPGSVPRAETGRTFRHLGRGDARRNPRAGSPRRAALGRLHRWRPRAAPGAL